MTKDRRFITPYLIVLAAAASSACRDAPLAENVRSNQPPIAHAGDRQMLEYDGSPVAVTLDGSGSTDADGKVVKYRWFTGNTADGGGPGGPEPDDVAKPKVMLDEGEWIFTLFVVDNQGGVSEPSTVTIKVGSGASPEATECSNDALPTISEGCRLCVCGESDMCRTAIAACDQLCWDFYGCLQNECAEFLNDMTAVTNCITSKCSSFIGGGLTYQSLAPCVASGPCAAACAASVTM